MKFAFALFVVALGNHNFQAQCHHHNHHHHHHKQHENQQYAIARLYPQEHCQSQQCNIPQEYSLGHHSHEYSLGHHNHGYSLGHHNHGHYGGHHNHEYFGGHYGTHLPKENIGATIHTTYCGSAYEPNQHGQQECTGSYSGSNVFVQPAVGQYDQFAVKCKTILQSLLDFISRPVEFGCPPGSALKLDLQSRIMNHNFPCETVCVAEGGIVPVLEDKVVEVPVPVSTPECTTEVYPVAVRPHSHSECGTCSGVSTVPTVKVIPVEVAPVHREPVHHIHLEPSVVTSRPYHQEVVYEKPVVEAEIITPQVCEEEDPKETKHQLHNLHKQIHHMMHNQKKHHHHHRHQH